MPGANLLVNRSDEGHPDPHADDHAPVEVLVQDHRLDEGHGEHEPGVDIAGPGWLSFITDKANHLPVNTNTNPQRKV